MAIIQRARINPKSLTHADVMQLQRTIGNRAVGKLLTEIGLIPSTVKLVQRQEIPEQEETCPSCMQRQEIPEEEVPLQGKMIKTIQCQKISEEEGPLQGKMIGIIQRQEIPEEEEPLQGKFVEPIQRQEIPKEEEPLQGKIIETIQRQEIPEEEEPLQGKMIETIQRQEIPEEEEPLQGKMIETIQRQEITEEEEPLQGKMVDTIQRQEIPKEDEPLHGKFNKKPEQETCPLCSTLPIQREKENRTGMPDDLKAGVENLSGIDMSDVRVHYNSDKPVKVEALAYTQGTDIHVAPGQEIHLPHEAWHVVQQKQGRVQPTMQMKGARVNDNVELEKEATVLGNKAFQFKGSRLQRKHRLINANMQIKGSSKSLIQRQPPEGEKTKLEDLRLQNFPDDVLAMIFSHLTPKDIASYRRVNKRFAKVGSDTMLSERHRVTFGDIVEDLRGFQLVGLHGASKKDAQSYHIVINPDFLGGNFDGRGQLGEGFYSSQGWGKAEKIAASSYAQNRAEKRHSKPRIFRVYDKRVTGFHEFTSDGPTKKAPWWPTKEQNPDYMKKVEEKELRDPRTGPRKIVIGADAVTAPTGNSYGGRECNPGGCPQQIKYNPQAIKSGRVTLRLIPENPGSEGGLTKEYLEAVAIRKKLAALAAIERAPTPRRNRSHSISLAALAAIKRAPTPRRNRSHSISLAALAAIERAPIPRRNLRERSYSISLAALAAIKRAPTPRRNLRERSHSI
jgi:hypothetical protein